MANLAPKAKVLRDGRWSEQDAAVLAPGDIISLGRAQRAMDGHSHRNSECCNWQAGVETPTWVDTLPAFVQELSLHSCRFTLTCKACSLVSSTSEQILPMVP